MHEYMKRLLLAVDKGIIDRQSIMHAYIGHDDWCGTYNGLECNCDPDITLTAEGKTFYVACDGTLLAVLSTPSSKH